MSACLRHDYFSCALQYELDSFLTMATYWVLDLPNIKGLSVHLWRSILIFANGASYVLFSKHINMLANNFTSIILLFERTVK